MSSVFCLARIYLDEIADVLSLEPSSYGVKKLKDLFFDLKLEPTRSMYVEEIESRKSEFEIYLSKYIRM